MWAYRPNTEVFKSWFKGASKNGDATFAIESLDSVSDVSSLRYKFGATFANDDTSDEDWSHDYDVTLDLQ